MLQKNLVNNNVLPLLLIIGLLTSFWYNTSWMILCAGLALFIFGMQCLQDGMHKLAGSKLEIVLNNSTSNRFKSFLFGVGGTVILQSTTLMSLLAIAFISSGLITLMVGISIVLGINLGASAGFWLLALAGQGFNLSNLAMPLIVIGVLCSFNGNKTKFFGRILLGIAFILLGITYIKDGFSIIANEIGNIQGYGYGVEGQFILISIGVFLTFILQSSHATIILCFAALNGNQIDMWQAMLLAIGANIGSSVTTAIMGFLGSNSTGKQLAIMHAIFNLITAAVAWIFLLPISIASNQLMQLTAVDNHLIELALFITIFNLVGVLIFWPLQSSMNKFLQWLIPDIDPPDNLVAEHVAASAQESPLELPVTPSQALYLDNRALVSVNSAIQAVLLELRHLRRICFEVICYSAYQPISQIDEPHIDEQQLLALPTCPQLNANELYKNHIKTIYAELVEFMSKFDQAMHSNQLNLWTSCQLTSWHLVETVKEIVVLQKSLAQNLVSTNNKSVINYYLELRRCLVVMMRMVEKITAPETPKRQQKELTANMKQQAENFFQKFYQNVFVEVKKNNISSLVATSLINDYGILYRIVKSWRKMLPVLIANSSSLLPTEEDKQLEKLDKLRRGGGI